MARAGLELTGHFVEPVTGLDGVEISKPGCSQPLALLPVLAWNAEVAPDALRYRDGAYNIAYAYDGNLYSAAWITYGFGVVSRLSRLKALAEGSDPRRLTYYFKVWTPQFCEGLTAADVERLRDAD